MTTLLEKVVAIPKRHSKGSRKWGNTEQQDVALAWLKNEISYTQINLVMGIRGTNFYNFMATCLRKAYENNRLVIKK